jgi:metallo-beta-lactamase family protein
MVPRPDVGCYHHKMKLTFWGAVRTVTGSMHELTVDGRRVLLDCGLYQGRREESSDRNRNFPFPGKSVDTVVLSHAHIDHSGNLPSLARTGFNGPIHATSATADLCGAMLRDSAFLQEKDAEFLNKRFERRRKFGQDDSKQIQPLYTMKDAETALELFHEVAYHKPVPVTDSLSYTMYDAGHLLGSAAVALEHRSNGRTTRLTFSGDVGRRGLPIIRDPERVPEADYLIIESTYGGRLHNDADIVVDKLAGVITRTAERGGRVIVPAFAVGRTQQLVLLLNHLTERKAIPDIPVFVDSPLAVNATEVYRKHTECYDAETARYLTEGDDPFAFRRLRYVRDVQDSKALNDLRGPMVIISASGMAEAGRILHHLRNNIENPRNTVLVVGFQAENTLGRKIVEKRAEVPIFGEPVRLRAEVVVMNELSGHADQNELLAWMRPVAPTLKRVFLVHGELDQAQPLANRIRETHNVDVVIPERGQSFEL